MSLKNGFIRFPFCKTAGRDISYRVAAFICVAAFVFVGALAGWKEEISEYMPLEKIMGRTMLEELLYQPAVLLFLPAVHAVANSKPYDYYYYFAGHVCR